MQSYCWDCHRWEFGLLEPNRELATRVHQLYTATPFELKLDHFANPVKEVGKDEEVISTEIDQVNRLRCHSVYGRPSISEISW